MDNRTRLRFDNIEAEKQKLERQIVRLKFRYEQLANEQQRILNRNIQPLEKGA